jgi:4-carboxymuconolactone decarboxylase
MSPVTHTITALAAVALIAAAWDRPGTVAAALGAQAKVDADGSLPRDIDPITRSRLPPLKRDELNEANRRLYDAAGPNGPQGAARLRLYRSGISARWDPPFGRQLSELAIISTAREHDQPYEWSLHEMEAHSVGVDREIIDIVRHKGALTAVPEREATVIQLAREVFGKHELSAATYARALRLFGQTNLVDIVDLMAGYAGTAVNLTAANQWMPPQMKQLLPLPFTMPDDILPDSRSRIPAVNPDNPSQGQPGVPTGGPYRRTLAPPPTGPGAMSRFADGIKSLENSQGRALIGLAILATAREHNQQYDWTMNEPVAVKDGLAAAVIDVVRHRRALTGLGEKEATLIQFIRELFQQHHVTAATYARARKVFGQRDLSDFVVGPIAQHARDAGMLIAFDQRLPAGQKPLLPVP